MFEPCWLEWPIKPSRSEGKEKTWQSSARTSLKLSHNIDVNKKQSVASQITKWHGDMVHSTEIWLTRWDIYIYTYIYIYYLTLKSLDMPSRFPELYRFPNDSKTIDMAQRWLKQTPENLQLESEVIFHSQQLNVAPVMWHQIKDIKLMTWKRLSTHSKRSDWQQNMQVFTINGLWYNEHFATFCFAHSFGGIFFVKLVTIWPMLRCKDLGLKTRRSALQKSFPETSWVAFVGCWGMQIF